MASTYLSRTPTGGNYKTSTFSCWVKRSNLSGEQHLLCFYNSSNNYQVNLKFINSSNTIQWQSFNGSVQCRLVTNSVFRDTSAWYHIVANFDTTQATSSNRAKLWINGEQVTSFSTETYPSQNADLIINGNSLINYVGTFTNSQYFFDGSMAHVHWIDGTAYDASTFGETDATTGIWKPKTAPSVTYGTNGFFLKFENSGSMGTDSSGNANNFTVNGTLTQTVDTPSNVFATLNPLASGVAIGGVAGTFANGNTFFSGASAAWCATKGTIAITQGKYYFEAKKVTNANGTGSGAGAVSVGFAELQSNLGNNNPQTDSAIYNSILVVNDNGWTTNFANGTQWSTPQAVNDGDIVGIALDLDGNNYTFYVNGTQVDTGSLGAGYDGNGLTPCLINYGGDTREFYCNFGNGYFGTVKVTSANSDTAGIGEFEYSVPDGYYSLCTKNINLLEYS